MVVQQNLLQTPATNQSDEQTAIGGGGATNKQQVSNFMSALNQSGSSAGNNFMNQQNGNQSVVAPPMISSVPNAMGATTAANTVGTAPITNAGQVTAAPNVQQNLLPNTLGTNAGGITTQPNAYGGIGVATTGTVGNQGGNYFGGIIQDGYSISGNNISQVTPVHVLNGGNVGAGSNPAGTYQPPGSVQSQTLSGTGGTGGTEIPGLTYVPTPSPTPVGTVNGNTLGGLNDVSTLKSDENFKTNIQSASSPIHDFLNKINAHQYEYKHPDQDGVGTFHSPMAQELEKTELGKQAVIETPRGKMVNYGRLSAVNLAAVSVVHREQQKLEKQIIQLRKELHKRK